MTERSRGKCDQLQCVNGGVCVVDSQRMETCQYVASPFLGVFILVICKTPSKRRTNERTDGQRDTPQRTSNVHQIAAVTPCRRRCDSSTMSKTNGRTNERTDAGNRIWCILASNVTSGGNNFNDFPDNQLT